MLKQRIITAIVLITIIGAGILLLPPIGLAALFGVLVVIAAWEWAAMAGLSAIVTRLSYAVFIALLIFSSAYYSQVLSANPKTDLIRDILGAGCLWWAVAFLWVRSFPASAVIWRAGVMRMVMGALTLVPAWMAVVYLRHHEYGIELIFLVIAIVASADIGAYFSGRAWGKSKLAVAVSPGKSWAGFWGGLTSSVSVVIILWLLFDGGRHGLLAVVAIVLVTALASVLGDLLESMMKRQQGIKDSGRILPGHGGMMDRLDSMTAAAPVFALCLLLVGW
ncbi:MAG: phosphatidate cytidylyltransferase [Oceanicoccus sp.]